MAWTPEQNEKFRDLIKERSQVETNINTIKLWNLQELHADTILKNITDDEKQKILDALIAARRPVLDKAIIEKQAEIAVINSQITAEDSLVTKP